MKIKTLLISVISVLTFSVQARTAFGDVIYLYNNPIFSSGSSHSSGAGNAFELFFAEAYADNFIKESKSGLNITEAKVSSTTLKDFGNSLSSADYYDLEIKVDGHKYTCDLRIKPLNSQADDRDKLVKIDDCVSNEKINGRKVKLNLAGEIAIIPRPENETNNKKVVDTNRNEKKKNSSSSRRVQGRSPSFSISK